jgi:hypothetical protein
MTAATSLRADTRSAPTVSAHPMLLGMLLSLPFWVALAILLTR